MKILSYSKRDIQNHIKRNSIYYFLFLLAMVIGVLIATVILISNDAYLSLIISKNKLIYTFINGTQTKGSIFFERFSRFVFPLIIIFIFGLNHYCAFFSLAVVSYHFCILFLTISAIINMYYFSGVLVSLFLIIPINLFYFAIITYFGVICLERSKLSHKQKDFTCGFDEIFFIKSGVCIALILILSFFVSFILPILLKSAIFSIY